VHTLSTTFLPLPLLSVLYFASGTAVGGGITYFVALSPGIEKQDLAAFLDTWTFTALLATGTALVFTAAMGAVTYSGEKLYRSLGACIECRECVLFLTAAPGTLWTPMHDKQFNFDGAEDEKEDVPLDHAVVYLSASGRKFEFA